MDELTARYGDLLTGAYDCVDRIVLNAYFSMGHSPGGFRTWWRRLHGSDEHLDNTHLMRMAGRFARRVRGWAKANGVPVIDTKSGERKHLIAEEYLATHSVGVGVFLVLVSRAPATVWKVTQSRSGVIVNLENKREYVNHYSFHIRDPDWGHLTIKMSGHPPFGAQVMLNGHEYVACAARRAGVDFVKEGNCFTALTQPERLAEIAETVSQPGAAGLLRQVCDSWIYSACVCFGLDFDEQRDSGFGYSYSVYQVEYSHNLLFANGARMQRTFDAIVDRTRSRLDVPTIRTLFGAKARPHRDRAGGPPRLEAVIGTPRYDLTTFKVHFGRLTLKAYTKGEHVLRVEAITHNTKELRCGRVLDHFGDITARLRTMAEAFCTTLDCVDVTFVPDGLLDELPQPSMIGATRVGGIDMNQARTRNTMAAVLALAVAPTGFTVADLASKVQTMTGQTDNGYTVRQAAYDLRKLRAKHLVDKLGRSHRYHVPPNPARVMAGLVALRDHVIAPILAGVRSPRQGRKPSHWTTVDRDYEQIRINMQQLFHDLAIDRVAA
jgi:hypothetical protein